jgi:tetratricopeptide (TPR) repeat protein
MENPCDPGFFPVFQILQLEVVFCCFYEEVGVWSHHMEHQVRTGVFNRAAIAVVTFGITVTALTGCRNEESNREQESSGSGLLNRDTAAARPDPSLSPKDVVRIQLEALRNNDDTDNGIRIAFGFASPGNKAVMGPLDRFTTLLKGPLYNEMLNYSSQEFGPMIVHGDSAQQQVTLVVSKGVPVRFRFFLSRQRAGRLEGCWLTDGVLREDHLGTGGRLRAELDLQLDSLFEQLRTTTDSRQLEVIEERIWRNWMRSGDADIDDLLEQGTAALENGRPEEAIRFFDIIIQRMPEFPEAWNKRATAYYLEGDFEASLDDIESTLALEKRHFGALSGLSMIYSALGDHARALSALESMHEIYPHKAGLKERIEELKAKLGIRST